jgi:hypothetical protein
VYVDGGASDGYYTLESNGELTRYFSEPEQT